MLWRKHQRAGGVYSAIDFSSTLENKLIGYADNSTLMAVVPSPGIRVTLAESMTLAGLVSGVTFWG